MLTGWLKQPEGWHWTNIYGHEHTGWLLANGKWYYLDSEKDNISLSSQWEKIGECYYYFLPSCQMVTGWLKLGGEWFYFDALGSWNPNFKLDGMFLGTSRGTIVAELEAHQWDSYYLGTRYVGLNLINVNKDACMHPNGDPGYNGYTGMNCTVLWHMY